MVLLYFLVLLLELVHLVWFHVDFVELLIDPVMEQFLLVDACAIRSVCES